MPGFLRHLLVFHGFPHAQCIAQAPQLEHHRTQQDRQRRHRQQRLPLALPQLRARQRPKPLPGSQEPRLGRSPAIERLVCCLMMLNWGQLPTGILTIYFLYLRVGFLEAVVGAMAIYEPLSSLGCFLVRPLASIYQLKDVETCRFLFPPNKLWSSATKRWVRKAAQLVWEANYKVISQTKKNMDNTHDHY